MALRLRASGRPSSATRLAGEKGRGVGEGEKDDTWRKMVTSCVLFVSWATLARNAADNG